MPDYSSLKPADRIRAIGGHLEFIVEKVFTETIIARVACSIIPEQIFSRHVIEVEVEKC